MAVEDGDHQDGDDIVGHGQRAQKHAHAAGNAVAQQSQDTQRERDVGGGGDAPALHGFGIRRVEHQVDADGGQHAADGSHDGQQRLADVRQLAHRQLVFHFQAHQQEEHSHEDVVDHVRQRHARERVAEEEARLGVPELQERLVRARVRHDERHDGRQQHDAGRLRRRVGELDEFPVSCLMTLHFVDENALRSVLILFGHVALSASSFAVLSLICPIRSRNCYPFLDRFHNRSK